MSSPVDLERRYRRLLLAYPRDFRREQEQEMLSVLMACAHEGQRWPGRQETLNLLGNAARIRLRHGFDWEYRHHPRVWFWIRVLVGLWLTLLTCILCAGGQWWGLSLLAPAALHFYLAFRLDRFIQAHERDGQPPAAAAGG